jgi:hypothetical protein
MEAVRYHAGKAPRKKLPVLSVVPTAPIPERESVVVGLQKWQRRAGAPRCAAPDFSKVFNMPLKGTIHAGGG